MRAWALTIGEDGFPCHIRTAVYVRSETNWHSHHTPGRYDGYNLVYTKAIDELGAYKNVMEFLRNEGK